MGGGVKRMRHRAEYWLLRAFVAAMERSPAALASGGARAAADAAFLALRARRRTAIENIERSSLGIRGAAARRVARDAFRHMAAAALESVRMRPVFEAGAWRDHVRLLDEPVLRGMPAGQGLVLASGHFGNWELGAHVFAQYRPLAAIARPMNNPRTDAILARYRFYGGVRGVPKHAARARRLLDLLTGGEALAVMIDQNARNHGLTLNFLGRPAPTYLSAARLSLHARVPIYFAWCRRLGYLRYETAIRGPFHCRAGEDRQAAIRDMTILLNAELEAVIRQAPEQYMWMHRRWRSG
jgi:KDO2-lipid IV(A) lauroyltransferase